MDRKYYIVVAEWNYPTETGRETIGDFDSKDEALTRGFELCDSEYDNFYDNCGDPLPPEECKDEDGNSGVIITPKNGLDDWFYVVRIVEMRNFR